MIIRVLLQKILIFDKERARSEDFESSSSGYKCGGCIFLLDVQFCISYIYIFYIHFCISPHPDIESEGSQRGRWMLESPTASILTCPLDSDFISHYS